MIMRCHAAAIRFLRHPKNPKKLSADSSSGRATGSGTGAGVTTILSNVNSKSFGPVPFDPSGMNETSRTPAKLRDKVLNTGGMLVLGS